MKALAQVLPGRLNLYVTYCLHIYPIMSSYSQHKRLVLTHVWVRRCWHNNYLHPPHHHQDGPVHTSRGGQLRSCLQDMQIRYPRIMHYGRGLRPLDRCEGNKWRRDWVFPAELMLKLSFSLSEIIFLFLCRNIGNIWILTCSKPTSKDVFILF